jgi:hypothetical protein
MKLNGRITALETIIIPPPAPHIVLTSGAGWLGEPLERRQAREEAALDLYGRDRIGAVDNVIVVHFLRPARDVQ